MRVGRNAKVTYRFEDFAKSIVSICDVAVTARQIWKIGTRHGWDRLLSESGGFRKFKEYMSGVEISGVKRIKGREDTFVYARIEPYDPLCCFDSGIWYWAGHHRSEIRTSRVGDVKPEAK